METCGHGLERQTDVRPLLPTVRRKRSFRVRRAAPVVENSRRGGGWNGADHASLPTPVVSEIHPAHRRSDENPSSTDRWPKRHVAGGPTGRQSFSDQDNSILEKVIPEGNRPRAAISLPCGDIGPAGPASGKLDIELETETERALDRVPHPDAERRPLYPLN